MAREELPMIGNLLHHTQVQTIARYAHLGRSTRLPTLVTNRLSCSAEGLDTPGPIERCLVDQIARKVVAGRQGRVAIEN